MLRANNYFSKLQDVAYLLRSRVALFEGTWLKHHAGTAFVPGGQWLQVKVLAQLNDNAII